MLKGWGSMELCFKACKKIWNLLELDILRGGDLSFLPRSISIFRCISKYEPQSEIFLWSFMSRVRPSNNKVVFVINIHNQLITHKDVLHFWEQVSRDNPGKEQVL
jgi:hypothetical protein